MVWTLFGPNVPPVYRLGICLVSCPSRTRGFHRASLEGGQHQGMPCLFPFLPFLGPGLPLLFSVVQRYWWLDHLM